MTSISVERPGSALRLHSCPACGRHAWHADGRRLDRSTVLDALRVPVSAPRRRPEPAVAAPEPPAEADEAGRRAELQQLLGGFTVHGTSS